MELNQKEFEKKLSSHKKLIKELTDKYKIPPLEDKDFFLFQRLKKQGKHLSLIISRFSCEKCGSRKRLSWHHLILRKSKEYMTFDRYISSRHYWNNIVVLCWPCHKKYHGFKDTKKKTIGETSIPKVLINRLKSRYFVIRE